MPKEIKVRWPKCLKCFPKDSNRIRNISQLTGAIDNALSRAKRHAAWEEKKVCWPHFLEVNSCKGTHWQKAAKDFCRKLQHIFRSFLQCGSKVGESSTRRKLQLKKFICRKLLQDICSFKILGLQKAALDFRCVHVFSMHLLMTCFIFPFTVSLRVC